ncbi:uncharacterized protein V1513DRAFT_386139 [Lipomyces chichibuensis]|uniref:uncharacterized protein n=1 Tax=Lipomyces chichibuensis TaxID=1546026 RepID=UPI0033440832
MLTVDSNASRLVQLTDTRDALASQSASGSSSVVSSGGRDTPTAENIETSVFSNGSRFNFRHMNLPTDNGVDNHSIWYVPQLSAAPIELQQSSIGITHCSSLCDVSSLTVPRDNTVAGSKIWAAKTMSNIDDNSLWSMQLIGSMSQFEEGEEKMASAEYIVSSQLTQPYSDIDLSNNEYTYNVGLRDYSALAQAYYHHVNHSLDESFILNPWPEVRPLVDALNIATDLKPYEDYFVKLDSGEFSELQYHLSQARFANSVVPAVSYNSLSKVVRIRSHVRPPFLNAIENFMMNTILKTGSPVFIDSTPKTHEKRLEDLEYCYQKMKHIYKGSRLSACSSLAVESELSPHRREITTLFLNGYYENLNQLCQDAFTLLLDYHVKTVIVTAVKEYSPNPVKLYDVPLAKLSQDLDTARGNSMMIAQVPEFVDFCKDFDWHAYEETGLYTYNGEHLVGQLYTGVIIWKRLDNKGNYNCRTRIEFPVTRKEFLENNKFGLRFDDMASPVRLNGAKIGCAEIDFDMEECWRQMQRSIQMTAFERYMRGVRLVDLGSPTAAR